MIEVHGNDIIHKMYQFEAYFDCTRCIPNMGSNGMQNIETDGTYITTQWCIKNKIRRQMRRMGEKVLHVDDEDNTPIINRLIGNESLDAYSDGQLMEMEKEHIDVRLFGTMDVADKDKPQKDGEDKDKTQKDVAKKEKTKIKLIGSGPISVSHATTLNPVEIFHGVGSRSYDVMHDDNGKNIGSSYNNAYWFVEYGLFKFVGGVNLDYVKFLNTTERDLDVFFKALWRMFDQDASSYRPMGSMRMRQLTVWEWDPDIDDSRLDQIRKMIYDEERMEFIGAGYGNHEYLDRPARRFADYKPYKKPGGIDGVRVYTKSC